MSSTRFEVDAGSGKIRKLYGRATRVSGPREAPCPLELRVWKTHSPTDMMVFDMTTSRMAR